MRLVGLVRSGVAAAAAVACSLLLSPARGQDWPYRPPEYGYGYGEIEQARTVAMAGAAHALGSSTTSIALNPANLVSQRGYHLEALFALSPDVQRLQYGAAILDSITSELAVGLLAAKTDLGGDRDFYRRSSLDIRLAAGYPISDKVSLGLTGRFLQTNQNGLGPLRDSGVSRSSRDDDTVDRRGTLDGALSLRPLESLTITLFGHNVTGAGQSLTPLSLGGAVGFKIGKFAAEADAMAVEPATWGAWKLRASVGAEYLAFGHLPLRLGYSFDQGSRRHTLGGGTGWVDPSFAVDVGLRGEIAGPSDPWGRALVFAIGLRYFLEGATESAPSL